MDFYVYLHKKKTTGEVFYVGKGCGNRAWVKFNRSVEWQAVVLNCGYYVELVENNIQGWYAYELEAQLIYYYGRADSASGTLVNKRGGVSCDFWSTLTSREKDYSEYTFYNLKSEITFTGNRYEFKKLYPDVNIPFLFRGNTSSRSWTILDSKTDAELSALKAKFKGTHSKLASKKEFHLFNYFTGCEFRGTRQSFKDVHGFVLYHLLQPKKKVFHEKGWCFYEDKDSVSRLTVYHLIHRNGDEFIGTRTEFNTKYQIDIQVLFNTKPSLCANNWALFANKAQAFSRGNIKTVYRFVHKTGDIFIGTRGEIEEKFGINIRPLFGKGSSKTQKGWRVENSLD